MSLLFLIACIFSVIVQHAYCLPLCGPSYKVSANGTACEYISTTDVLRALHYLAKPPTTSCSSVSTVQGISICEDFLPKNRKCHVASVIASTWCDHYGSLAFEKYWLEKGCDVTLYHFTVFFKGNTCNNDDELKKTHPGMKLIRNHVWLERCYNCFYKHVAVPDHGTIDILKIQDREGVYEDYDGVQYTILSDMYLNKPELMTKIKQIAVKVSMTSMSLVDNVGREGEGAWNMWATEQFLRPFASHTTRLERGRQQPLQFDRLLGQAGLDTSIGSYVHTFVHLDNALIIQNSIQERLAWQPILAPPIEAAPPPYCRVPSAVDNEEMQKWIRAELNVRCHPTRLWVPCERNRPYVGFVPCEQELSDLLADDYTSSKGWCDFSDPTAAIEPLTKVDPRAAKTFQDKGIKPKAGVRFAFFFTVYTDSAFMRRLLSRLYSPDHFYLIHVDPTGASAEFRADMNALAEQYAAGNVFVASDVPIVYGASTATILLSRAMAWFAKYTSGWDYFVPLTGSDYPLVPLHRMEKIFAYQKPPMPFVMVWTAGTSTHLFRLGRSHQIFENDPLLARSIKAVTDERGKILGQVPMEYRSTNFGPPVFCNGKQAFFHLDNRRNKSATVLDTQWLFPRDRYPGRGRAYADENPNEVIPTVDNIFRVWKKSDPATTGAYDRETVDYIATSVEGRKYYHFFRNMLLGSEEHYYASLLYNWPRTRAFVQTLSAQMVWNTWELGLWENSGGGFQTHTHFLSMGEWDILRGFALRGMIFPRKFSTSKTKDLLDKIDEYIHFNASTDAGRYWPGYFETDITTYGRGWVQSFHRNASLRAKGLLPPYTLPKVVTDPDPLPPVSRSLRSTSSADVHNSSSSLF